MLYLRRVSSLIKKIKEYIFWKLRGDIPVWAYTKRGMKVGKNFSLQPGCHLDYSHCWLIEIGEEVTLAPKVHILAHDASTKRALDYTKIGRVTIGSRVFIGAGTIILPNVIIGDDVVIGAGSVVTKDVTSGSIAAGNPAKIIGKTLEYLEKNRRLIDKSFVYDEEYTIIGGITLEKQEKMKEQLKQSVGFVK
jgi:maltose O-acetyltransferase